LLDSLIERLKYPRVYRGDYIDGCIQFFFGHPRVPCVRKAAIYSRIAEPHHCDGKTDEHLLALGQTFHGVGVAVEGSEVCFFQDRAPL
jgi:hypothetical protein